MMRAFLAGGGLILTVVGLAVSWATVTVDGWTVLAAVGVGMLWIDWRIEKAQAQRAHEGLRDDAIRMYKQGEQ